MSRTGSKVSAETSKGDYARPNSSVNAASCSPSLGAAREGVLPIEGKLGPGTVSLPPPGIGVFSNNPAEAIVAS
ncbi:MAG: hypothetical protein KC457_28515, partial [Myxococcales bacterium]|nr:hypothetical protein [Myxococcales bacterium]